MNWGRFKNSFWLEVLVCVAIGSTGANSQTDPVWFFGRPVSSSAMELRQADPLSRGEEQALKPLDTFKECPACPEMVVVPSGKFIMGALVSEPASQDDERPEHQVTMKRLFAVGRYAITFAEWDACVADGGCRGYHPADKWGRGLQPVINLWWDDAKAYVKWLSEKTGKTYRLLSETEREYVTRAGTTTPFWWGSTISTDQANYDGTFAYPPLGDGPRGVSRGKTLPVDSFRPNPWGVYQVHGNVYEWAEDCWHNNYARAPADGSAWTTVGCERHIMRGGAWNFAPWQLRSAARGSVASAVGLMPVSMRVARALNP